jgi:hypothetical protein
VRSPAVDGVEAGGGRIVVLYPHMYHGVLSLTRILTYLAVPTLLLLLLLLLLRCRYRTHRTNLAGKIVIYSTTEDAGR